MIGRLRTIESSVSANRARGLREPVALQRFWYRGVAPFMSKIEKRINVAMSVERRFSYTNPTGSLV